MTDLDDVRRIVQTLPETTSEGQGFGVRGKGFAWTYMEKIPGRKGRVQHDDVLAVRVANLDEKVAVLAAYPEKTFTDAHYNGFPAVLVRLPLVDLEELTDFLTEAWRIQAPRKLVKEFDLQRQTVPSEP